MSPKSLLTVFAAVAAALVNVAFVAPAHAQVKAALVRDADRSTAHPVNGSCEAFAPSSGAWAKCVLYNVPPGKRLVVETVSYQAYSQAGTPVTQIIFGLNDPVVPGLRFPGANTYQINPMVTYDRSGVRSYSGTQALRIYIDENQSFAAGNTKDGTVNLDQGFAFSGYLIDK